MPLYNYGQSFRKAALSSSLGFTPRFLRTAKASTDYGYMNNGSNTITLTSKRKKPRFGKRNSFKQKLLKNLVAKHKVTDDTQTQKINATQNTIYTCNLTAGIVQGTQDDQRIGDSIHLAAVKVAAQIISASATTQPTQFRVIIGYSGEEYNLPNTLGAGLTNTEIFQTGTGTNSIVNGIINPKAFTVLDDRIVTINNIVLNQNEFQQESYTVQCDSPFPYQSKGSVFGKTRNLYLVVMANINAGVNGTTVAGTFNICTDLIFKDLA